MSALYLTLLAFLLILVIVYLLLRYSKYRNLLFTKAILIIIIAFIFCGLSIVYGRFTRLKSGLTYSGFINELRQKYFSHFNNSASLDNQSRLISYTVTNTSSFPVTANNKVEILQNGRETFDYLLSDLKNAENYIHIEDFIIRDDNISKEFQEIIKMKAKQGIKVRLLLDGLGARLKRQSINDLKAAGVDLQIVNPLIKSALTGNFNYRDHRKIFIIDGKIAYTGGINIGDEYLSRDPKKGFWRDTDIRLEGDSVKQIQSIFVSSWYTVTGEKLDSPVFFPNLDTNEHSLIQIVDGNPNTQTKSVKFLYLNLINSATESIYISTPYLVLDKEVYNALANASLKGVDVRIIIPNKADVPFEQLAYMSTLYYSEHLTNSKVKIYKYTKGYIHAKVIITDKKTASVGTANLNNRSLNLDYENCVLVYDGKVTNKLYEDYLNDLNNSVLLTPKDFKNKSISEKMLEKISLVLSPIQ